MNKNQANEKKGNVKEDAGNASGDKGREQQGRSEKHGGKRGAVLGEVNDSAKKQGLDTDFVKDINKELSESDQSNIRYLTWVIPSIGFVGTVLGISQALMIANSGDMKLITATLGVAFDTTLVSLLLSIIIMWYYHNLQKELDLLHAKIKDYVIENLINRIEIE